MLNQDWLSEPKEYEEQGKKISNYEFAGFYATDRFFSREKLSRVRINKTYY